MPSPSVPDRVQRRLRFLELYAALSSVALVVLVLAAFQGPARQELDVLDVRRINVLNASGQPALVIAGHGRLPGPTFEGTEYAQELSGGRTQASGMIFFNERGDEVGGLTYGGRLTDDAWQANGGITFDQFRQDQVVSLQYQDDGASRAAGVHVWDRSTEISIAEILRLVDARRTATGAARDSLEREIEALADRGLGARRVFLGSRDRTAALQLLDPEGRTRLRLSVDSLGAARLEFLDEDGQVVDALPR
jgi:hypothetical protein